MARDPNRPAPDESVTRQEPADNPQTDRQRSQPSERVPHRDGDIETVRPERGRGNEGVE